MLNVTCSSHAIRSLKGSTQSEFNERTVYILLAERPLKYPNGWSRIVYIGTTKRSRNNPTASALDKANEALMVLPRIGEVAMHVLNYERRKGMRTWEHLENSLLATFLACYGKLPKLNKKYNKRKSFRRQPENTLLFRQDKLEKMLLRLAV
jgi:hypothetical protein